MLRISRAWEGYCVCVGGWVWSESEHRYAAECISHALSFACFFLGLAYAETLLPVVRREGGGEKR